LNRRDIPMTKSIEASSVKEIFKVGSGKKNEFEESQKSLSLENDPIGDPKPIIFTNKGGNSKL
jgi:hypothetical protein